MKGVQMLVQGALVLLLVCQTALTLENGLARTPQMGYNTWNAFAGGIDEKLMKQTTDRMVKLGLLAAGYNYLNLDDGWQAIARNIAGELVADPAKFPSGMKALGEYVHGKGLQFGIYSDAGLRTCLGMPGSRHFEEQDATTFAEWGIDYLKYDNCFASPGDWVVTRYTTMRDALNATGRSVLFSMCEWGVLEPWLWGPGVGNSWRTTADIANSWNDVLRCLDESVGLSRYAGPGGWNDPDMLEVGNGVLSHAEERAHFALWAILKAPLIISADLRSLSAPSLSVLTAEEVIAVNQDPLGVPGDLIWKQGALEVYAAPLSGGARAVVMFNRHTTDSQYATSNITVTWEQLGLPADAQCGVRDLYTRMDLGKFTEEFSSPVGLHDVVATKITCRTSGSSDWRPWMATKDMFRHEGSALVTEDQQQQLPLEQQ